jgi:hypothetical protein
MRGLGGRRLVPTDNSPAQWVFTLAHSGKCPTIDELAHLLEQDKVPVAMAMAKDEKSKALRVCPLGEYSVNRRGWKLAHVEDVGFKSSQVFESASEEVLRKHFISFLSPSNMFLVPAEWSGLAEVEAFAKHFRWRDDT